MPKRQWLAITVALIVISLLAACGGANATPDSTPTAEPTAAPTDAPGEEPELPTPIPTGNPLEPVSVTPPEELGMCEAAPLPELPVRPVEESDWVKGADPEDAEVVIYEYSDFQCPGCAGMYPIVEDFLAVNPDVALVYRHFPLEFHQHAMITAEASEAAGAQGKFWEMHDLLFERAQEWSALPEDEIQDTLVGYAEDLDLDSEQFRTDLEEGTYEEKVQAQYDEGRELGLPGTPSFIYDNVLFPSDIGLSFQGLTSFLNILDSQDEIFYDAPPEMTVAEDDEYEAVVTTSAGEIRVRLLPESAPTHVNNFIFLSEEEWYNGSDFFLVRDNFVAVTGDPTNSSIAYPGYYCLGEEQSTFDRPGLVGMLPNGQFFFTLGSDAVQLSGNFALIGQVTEGLDVLDALTRVDLGNPAAPEPDVLESVEIVE